MSDDRPSVSAGTLLRRGREQHGAALATLATALKVAPAKLEALEADRLDALPDLAFARALAQAVCRQLRLDPAPVLAALPRPSGQRRLEQVAQGLNTPFTERPGRFPPDEWARLTASPLVWAALLVLVAAAVVYFMPIGWTAFAPEVSRLARPAASAIVVETVAGAGSGALSALPAPSSTPPAEAGTARIETVYSVPLDRVALPAGAAAAVEPVAAASTTTTIVTAAAGGVAPAAVGSAPAGLLIRTSAESWIEVSDAQGRALLSRIVRPGESVGLDGALPLQLRIGNAGATELSFRGQPVALMAHTRDNIARLELK